MFRDFSKASFLLLASWMRCLILARNSSRFPRSWGSSCRSFTQSCQISCLQGEGVLWGSSPQYPQIQAGCGVPGHLAHTVQDVWSSGTEEHWGDRDPVPCSCAWPKAPPSPFWALLPQACPPWAALPRPTGHPWVPNRAAYSSEMLSVPSWSIKAAKCLCSSLSAPSNITLGMAKRTLRDAVLRRRWSLAAFWELRNCPANRHTKPSVPARGNGEAQTPTLPTPGLQQATLAQ